jgi:hypothetical protein
MSDIFISYARADKDRAELLAKAFSRQGWSVWWDREIPPGKSFDETIENALNSARCVIVLWSKDSVSSRWVKTEAAEGAARGILIPALIDKVQIPLEFKRIEAADLSDWQGDSPHFEFDQLLNIVASILGGSAPTQIKQMLTNTKLRSRRWWETIPGLVSATVGIIIAMTGLIVAIHQVGFIDKKDKPIPPVHDNATKAPRDGSGSTNSDTGRIEGIILTDKGKPAHDRFSKRNGARITLQPIEGGRGLRTVSEPEKGGFYTFRELEPGIYEMFIDNSFQRDQFNRLIEYRPQRILNVVIESNKRTLLNITVHEGNELEEIGRPQ